MLALLAAMQAYPAAAADNALRGQFTFNWHADPHKTKCAQIGDPLLATLTSAKFKCDLSGSASTASGAPASAVCSATDGKSEYLVFGTLAACENERKTQAANGD